MLSTSHHRKEARQGLTGTVTQLTQQVKLAPAAPVNQNSGPGDVESCLLISFYTLVPDPDQHIYILYDLNEGVTAFEEAT